VPTLIGNMIENIPCASIYDRLHATVSRELSALLIELTKKRAKASRASFLSRFPITLTLVSSSAAYRSSKSFFSALLPPSLSLSLSLSLISESACMQKSAYLSILIPGTPFLRDADIRPCRNFSLREISLHSAHPPVYFNSYRRIPPLAPRLLRSEEIRRSTFGADRLSILFQRQHKRSLSSSSRI